MTREAYIDSERIGRAINLLREARNLARLAGARRTHARIVSALRSAEGALRHVISVRYGADGGRVSRGRYVR